MRTFHLVREHDVSGVSGTGVVAEGVEFGDGSAVIRWCTENKPRSTVVYDNIDDILSIHGHLGLTQIIYEDNNKVVLRNAAQRIEEFDTSDDYESSNPARHVPGFNVGYYAAMDRAVDLLNGRINSWTDLRPAPQNRT